MPFFSYNVLMFFICDKRKTVEVQTVFISSRRTCKNQAPKGKAQGGGARGPSPYTFWGKVKSAMQPSCHYDVTSRINDFQNSEQKCSSKRQIKLEISHACIVPVS